MFIKFSRPYLVRVIPLILSAFMAMSVIEASAMEKEMISERDIAGRINEVKKGSERIIFDESRRIYSVAVLDRENPFERVIGWKDNFIKYDPDAFENTKPFKADDKA